MVMSSKLTEVKQSLSRGGHNIRHSTIKVSLRGEIAGDTTSARALMLESLSKISQSTGQREVFAPLGGNCAVLNWLVCKENETRNEMGLSGVRLEYRNCR